MTGGLKGGINWEVAINIYTLLGFPGGSAGKESACNVGGLGSIPGLGRSPGEGNSYPLQYSGLENSMNCVVHGVTKSWTQLRDFHFTFLYYCCFTEMETQVITMSGGIGI